MEKKNSDRVISLEGIALIQQHLDPAKNELLNGLLGAVPLSQVAPTLERIKGILANTLTITEEGQGHIHFAHPIAGHLGTLHICRAYSLGDSSQYIE